MVKKIKEVPVSVFKKCIELTEKWKDRKRTHSQLSFVQKKGTNMLD